MVCKCMLVVFCPSPLHGHNVCILLDYYAVCMMSIDVLFIGNDFEYLSFQQSLHSPPTWSAGKGISLVVHRATLVDIEHQWDACLCLQGPTKSFSRIKKAQTNLWRAGGSVDTYRKLQLLSEIVGSKRLFVTFDSESNLIRLGPIWVFP